VVSADTFPKYADVQTIQSYQVENILSQLKNGKPTRECELMLEKYYFNYYTKTDLQDDDREIAWYKWIGPKKTMFKNRILTIHRTKEMLARTAEAKDFRSIYVSNLCGDTDYYTFIGYKIISADWACKMLDFVPDITKIEECITLAVELYDKVSKFVEKHESDIRKSLGIKKRGQETIKLVNLVLSGIFGVKIMPKYRKSKKSRYVTNYTVCVCEEWCIVGCAAIYVH
jgi:hypothetical protein